MILPEREKKKQQRYYAVGFFQHFHSLHWKPFGNSFSHIPFRSFHSFNMLSVTSAATAYVLLLLVVVYRAVANGCTRSPYSIFI